MDFFDSKRLLDNSKTKGKKSFSQYKTNRHLTPNNNLILIEPEVNGKLPEDIFQILDKDNLFLEEYEINPKYGSEKYLVKYSFNKSKRWLLPDVLSQKITELKESDKYFGTETDLQISVLSDKSKRSRKENTYEIKPLTHNEIKRSDNIKGNQNTKKRLTKEITERVQFKNGNRDRNSGIKRRNETFIQTENTEKPDIITTPSITYKLVTPKFDPEEIKCTKIKKSKTAFQMKVSKTKSLGSVIKEELDEFNSDVLNTNDIDNELESYMFNQDREMKISLMDALKANEVVHFNPFKNSLTTNKVNEDELKENLKVKLFHEETIPIKPESINFTKYTPDLKGSFTKVKFLVNNQNEFIQSVSYLVTKKDQILPFTLYQSCLPAKIIIDVNQIIYNKIGINKNKYNETYFIFDLPLNSSFHINTRISNVEFNDELDIEFNCIEHVIDYFVGKLIELSRPNLIVELKAQNNIFPQNFSNERNIFGKKAFADLHTVQRIYSTKLENQSRDQTNLNRLLKFSNEIHFKECPICCEETEYPSGFFSLESCGHESCLLCWNRYIETFVNNMKKNGSSNDMLTCIQNNCKSFMDLGVVCLIVNLNLVQKFIEFYSDLKIFKDKSFVYCKNRKCQKLILIEGKDVGIDFDFENENVSICECGFMVCRKCLNEAHLPASCEQAKDYLNNLNKMNISIPNLKKDKLYRSAGKNCPKCFKYMEKNGGCNHMSCICGAEFCW